MLFVLFIAVSIICIFSIRTAYRYSRSQYHPITTENESYDLSNKHQTNPAKPESDSEVEDELLFLVNTGYVDQGILLNAFSMNQGEDWYVIEFGEDANEKPMLLEQKHPHVSLRPKDWEKLKNYVLKNGAVNLSDRKGVKLLENAGFEVKTIKK